VNNELEGFWKAAIVVQFKVLSRDCTVEMKKTTKSQSGSSVSGLKNQPMTCQQEARVLAIQPRCSVRFRGACCLHHQGDHPNK
jgi:hypothetical protein